MNKEDTINFIKFKVVLIEAAGRTMIKNPALKTLMLSQICRLRKELELSVKNKKLLQIQH